MTHNLTPNSANLDDDLAAFTDQLLSGQHPDLHDDEQDELRGLQEMVMRLHQAVPAEKAMDSVMSARIKAKLDQEWQREMAAPPRLVTPPAAQPTRPKQWRSARSRQQLYTVGLAVAALLVIAVGLPFLSDTSGGTTAGSAVGSSEPAVIGILFLGLALGLLVWWRGRHR